MKVLTISGTFPPREFGGVTAVSHKVAKHLVKIGHEVTVYTTDVGNDSHSRLDVGHSEVIDGIVVRYFRNIGNSLAFKQRLYSPIRIIITMKNELKYFDIIHLHDYRTFQNIIAHHYAKKHGIPYVLQAHGSVLPFFAKQRLKNLYDMVWGYRILKDASKVIALNKTEAEQYKEMGVDESKIVIVPNGIELSEYEKLPDRGVFRLKYDIKNNEKIVLYLGRIHKSKGVDLLVDAFSDISNKLSDARLVLIGPNDGNQPLLIKCTQELEINDKVLFTGFVTDEEKIAAFVDADVFVTPRFSGFPITFLEACACGTPIITTDNGDKLDWINDKTGYVVEYDKEQLRDAILKLLSDDELRRRFGEEGMRLVRKEFNWGRIVEEVEEIYLSLASEHESYSKV